MTTTADVHAAAARIAGHIRVTPVTEADPGTFLPAGRVWLKLEQLQHTGTFKARGALNRILSAAEQGVIPAAGVPSFTNVVRMSWTTLILLGLTSRPGTAGSWSRASDLRTFGSSTSSQSRINAFEPPRNSTWRVEERTFAGRPM